jgi:hypothetical protein
MCDICENEGAARGGPPSAQGFRRAHGLPAEHAEKERLAGAAHAPAAAGTTAVLPGTAPTPGCDTSERGDLLSAGG